MARLPSQLPLAVCGQISLLARRGRLPQPTLQIRRQQLMKQMLPSFPPHRQPPRSISPRLQPPLHRLANPQILILYLVPHRDTLLVVSAPSFAYVAEVVIKDDTAMIHIDRNDQIRIQISLVVIEHEIGMQPEIPGPVTLPRRARGGMLVRSLVRSYHRTRLQTISVLILDRVLLVIQNRIKSFMQMRYVISAIQIVIHKYFPVTMDVVSLAGIVVQVV